MVDHGQLGFGRRPPQEEGQSTMDNEKSLYAFQLMPREEYTTKI